MTRKDYVGTREQRLGAIEHVSRGDAMNRYSAVVESGSWNASRQYEEREHCGHAHRTIAAAEACGARHYASRYVRGSWTANAAWHGYTVHTQDGRRVER